MPNRASSTGPMPAMSRPRKRTAPAVGRSKPVTTLTSVVLPAPFGPTIETNSPSLSWKETSLSALNAPKLLETLIVSNRTVLAAAREDRILSPSLTAVDQRRDRARQALPHEHHKQHQHSAHHEAPVLRHRHHKILQQHEGERTDRGSGEGAAAAKDGHEHQIAGMGPVGQFRIGETRGDGQNRS